MRSILNTHIEEGIFSLEDVDFGIKKLSNGKAMDSEGYQVENFKMGESIIIPHIHKLLNMVGKHGFPKPWTQSLIVPIFKSGDKNLPSNYMTIMISHTLAKLYGLIIRKRIGLWLESHDKRAKGRARFQRHHSTIHHLVTFRVIIKQCHNSKTDLLCCLKSFDTAPWDKLWKRLEKMLVLLELRVAIIYLYKNVVSKLKTVER